MTPMPIYLADADYDRLIAALVGPLVDADEVKLTLGEIANVWPERIRPDGDEISEAR
jgi:hypothetical protein